MPATTFKSGADVRVGDVINAPVHGRFAQVKALVPYTGPLLDILGEGSQIASFHGTPVELTLPAVGWAEVQA